MPGASCYAPLSATQRRAQQANVDAWRGVHMKFPGIHEGGLEMFRASMR